MMTPFLIAALASLSVSDTDPDILFSKHQSLGRDLDTVEIWLQPVSSGGELVSPHFVLRRTVSYQLKLKLPAEWQAQTTMLWASDVTCPQAIKLLESLTKLQVPAIKIAEMPADTDYAITVRADGAQYRMIVPGYYPGEPGKMDVTFGADTPIANWIDDGFRTIAPCWKSERPKQAKSWSH